MASLHTSDELPHLLYLLTTILSRTSSLATPTTISNTTPYAQDDYAERLNFVRLSRPPPNCDKY